MTSRIFKLDVSRERGPIIICCITPWFTQWSYQKLSLLFLPTVHLIPLLKTSMPFFIANHVWEHGSLFWLLKHSLRFEKYIDFKTRAQRDSFSTRYLEFSFARKAMFQPLATCNPNHSSILGLATFYQPIKWTFLVDSVVPQRKFLLTWSIPLRILPGR